MIIRNSKCQNSIVSIGSYFRPHIIVLSAAVREMVTGIIGHMDHWSTQGSANALSDNMCQVFS